MFTCLLGRVEARGGESNLLGGTKKKSKTKVRLAARLIAGVMMLSLSGPAFAAPAQFNTGNLVSALNNVNVEDSVNNNRVSTTS